jgi:hypothetical protein
MDKKTLEGLSSTLGANRYPHPATDNELINWREVKLESGISALSSHCLKFKFRTGPREFARLDDLPK